MIGSDLIGSQLITGMIPSLTGNAANGHVLNGETFYTTNALVKQTGTLALTGTAASNHALNGYTFYNTNALAIQTGNIATITNSEPVSAVLAGGTTPTLTVVPAAGYYDGVNSLSKKVTGMGSQIQNLIKYNETILGLTGAYTYEASGGVVANGYIPLGLIAYCNATRFVGTLALAGTATAGDVLAGVNFYNTNLYVGVNGTLALDGTAAVGDVLNGTTFYNTNAKSKQTGTLVLDGNAATNQVLNGATFYNTNAKSKLTGTATLYTNFTNTSVAFDSETVVVNGESNAAPFSLTHAVAAFSDIPKAVKVYGWGQYPGGAYTSISFIAYNPTYFPSIPPQSFNAFWATTSGATLQVQFNANSATNTVNILHTAYDDSSNATYVCSSVNLTVAAYK